MMTRHGLLLLLAAPLVMSTIVAPQSLAHTQVSYPKNLKLAKQLRGLNSSVDYTINNCTLAMNDTTNLNLTISYVDKIFKQKIKEMQQQLNRYKNAEYNLDGAKDIIWKNDDSSLDRADTDAADYSADNFNPDAGDPQMVTSLRAFSAQLRASFVKVQKEVTEALEYIDKLMPLIRQVKNIVTKRLDVLNPLCQRTDQLGEVSSALKNASDYLVMRPGQGDRLEFDWEKLTPDDDALAAWWAKNAEKFDITATLKDLSANIKTNAKAQLEDAADTVDMMTKAAEQLKEHWLAGWANVVTRANKKVEDAEQMLAPVGDDSPMSPKFETSYEGVQQNNTLKWGVSTLKSMADTTLAHLSLAMDTTENLHLNCNAMKTEIAHKRQIIDKLLQNLAKAVDQIGSSRSAIKQFADKQSEDDF